MSDYSKAKLEWMKAEYAKGTWRDPEMREHAANLVHPPDDLSWDDLEAWTKDVNAPVRTSSPRGAARSWLRSGKEKASERLRSRTPPLDSELMQQRKQVQELTEKVRKLTEHVEGYKADWYRVQDHAEALENLVDCHANLHSVSCANPATVSPDEYSYRLSAVSEAQLEVERVSRLV